MERIIVAARQPEPVLRPFYEDWRLRGYIAVTWFSHSPKPEDVRWKALPRLDTYRDQLQTDFGLVWTSPLEGTSEEGAYAARVAYVESTELGRLDLEPVQRLGFITLLWRKFGTRRVLEIHAKSAKLKTIVVPMLESIGVDVQALRVLDFRSNDCEVQLRAALKAKLTDAVALDDDPASPDDHQRFVARKGRSLAEEGSKFVSGKFDRAPGRGRTIDSEKEGLTVTVAQRDYSCVFHRGGGPEGTARLFNLLVNIGEWTVYLARDDV